MAYFQGIASTAAGSQHTAVTREGVRDLSVVRHRKPAGRALQPEMPSFHGGAAGDPNYDRQAEGGVALWNSFAAVLGTVPLTVAFGARIHTRNWHLLGDPVREAASRRVAYAGRDIDIHSHFQELRCAP